MVSDEKTNGPGHNGYRIDWDVRGIIAIMAVLGVFGLATAQLLTGLGGEIPTWAAALVSAITGFYFGSRGGETGK